MRTDGIHMFVFCARPHSQYTHRRARPIELYVIALPRALVVLAQRELSIKIKARQRVHRCEFMRYKTHQTLPNVPASNDLDLSPNTMRRLRACRRARKMDRRSPSYGTAGVPRDAERHGDDAHDLVEGCVSEVRSVGLGL